VLTVNERDIILADIPGIIEGAHEGAGLGLQFLKHIARTACLAFLVDLSDENWRTAFPTLLRELELFSPELTRKPRILLGTKMDLPEAQEHFAQFKAAFSEETVEVSASRIFQSWPNELKQVFFEKVVGYEAGEDKKESMPERLFDEIELDDEGLGE